MTHPEAGRPSAEELLALKANIRRDWDQLPPEHQASMALVLVEQVANGDYGEWFAQAIAVLDLVKSTDDRPDGNAK